MTIVIATSSYIFEQLVSMEDRSLVVVTAPGRCAACDYSKPAIDDFAKERLDYQVIMINADNDPDLVEYLDVKSLPTFIVLEGKEEIKRFSGSITKEELIKNIDD